jgi:hypothetical protein
VKIFEEWRSIVDQVARYASSLFPVDAEAVFGQNKFHQNLPENQCIFVRGFRVTRFLKMLPRVRGAAEPSQDADRDESEYDTQLITIPMTTDVRLSIRHPLTLI